MAEQSRQSPEEIMSEHTAEVSGYVERKKDHFTSTPAATIGSVVVRPPIRMGERFNNVVLGRNKHGVDIHEVASTNDATILLIESSLGATPEERMPTIDVIAGRIVQLANTPEIAPTLMGETPFPQHSDDGRY